MPLCYLQAGEFRPACGQFAAESYFKRCNVNELWTAAKWAQVRNQNGALQQCMDVVSEAGQKYTDVMGKQGIMMLCLLLFFPFFFFFTYWGLKKRRKKRQVES